LQATNELAKVKAYIDKYYQDMFIEVNRSMKDISDTKEIFLPETEPFSIYLFRKIDEKEMDDVSLYKKAQIDRRLFSKIRSDEDYQPSKKTVFKLVLAMELTYQEAKECLEYAGFAFSRSSKFDLIVEYAVKHQIYDIFDVNELLDELVNEIL